MNVTIVSVGPCRVINSHLVREEANGSEHVMLVDTGREFAVWRVHEMTDEGPAAVFHAFSGQYYQYDDRAAATVQFLSRSGLDRATLETRYA